MGQNLAVVQVWNIEASIMTKKEEQELKRQRKLQAELERLSKINTNWYDENR